MSERKLGAVPSPRHKLAAAKPHVAAPCPANFCRIPQKLSMWGNSDYGDCVSAEEAWAKDCDGVWVTDSDLVAWARKHGYLNGANLTDVMDSVAKDGLPSSGKTFSDGPYSSVDWTDYAALCSAIYTGPVKIGVAANQLEDAAGDNSGWWLTSAVKDRNIDHCTGVGGYGTAAWLAEQFHVDVPSGLDPQTPCVAMFTWNTIGIVTHAALIAITGEAWLRTPTTPEVVPTPPGPPGPPQPPPPDPLPSPAIAVGPVTLDVKAYGIELYGGPGIFHRIKAGNVSIPEAGDYLISFQKQG